MNIFYQCRLWVTLSVITFNLYLSSQCSLPYQATQVWPILRHTHTHHVDVTTMWGLCREGKLKPFDSLFYQVTGYWMVRAVRLSPNILWRASLTYLHTVALLSTPRATGQVVVFSSTMNKNLMNNELVTFHLWQGHSKDYPTLLSYHCWKIIFLTHPRKATQRRQL